MCEGFQGELLHVLEEHHVILVGAHAQSHRFLGLGDCLRHRGAELGGPALGVPVVVEEGVAAVDVVDDDGAIHVAGVVAAEDGVLVEGAHADVVPAAELLAHLRGHAHLHPVVVLVGRISLGLDEAGLDVLLRNCFAGVEVCEDLVEGVHELLLGEHGHILPLVGVLLTRILPSVLASFPIALATDLGEGLRAAAGDPLLDEAGLEDLSDHAAAAVGEVHLGDLQESLTVVHALVDAGQAHQRPIHQVLHDGLRLAVNVPHDLLVEGDLGSRVPAPDERALDGDDVELPVHGG